MEIDRKTLETLFILLLGVKDEPIPSQEHVKWEIEMLLKCLRKLRKENRDRFEELLDKLKL